MTVRRWSRSRSASPTASASSSAIPSRSTCSAATSPRASPTCARVDWQSLGINFVMVFSPNTFSGAPHTRLATLTFPDGGTPAQEGAIIRAVAADYPMVTTVRVKEALEAFGAIVSNLVLGIRGASAITLLAAALVLGGALAAGHRHPRLRRGHPQDAGRDAGAADRRLLDRIPAARRRHGFVRRAERLACRLADRGRTHASALCLAAVAGAGRGAGGACRHGRAGACRHACRARAETRFRIEKPLVFRDILPRRPPAMAIRGLRYTARTGPVSAPSQVILGPYLAPTLRPH